MTEVSSPFVNESLKGNESNGINRRADELKMISIGHAMVNEGDFKGDLEMMRQGISYLFTVLNDKLVEEEGGVTKRGIFTNKFEYYQTQINIGRRMYNNSLNLGLSTFERKNCHNKAYSIYKNLHFRMGQELTDLGYNS